MYGRFQHTVSRALVGVEGDIYAPTGFNDRLPGTWWTLASRGRCRGAVPPRRQALHVRGEYVADNFVVVVAYLRSPVNETRIVKCGYFTSIYGKH